MEYYYLVAYTWERGYGSAEITRKKAIVNFEDLRGIEKLLNKKHEIQSHIINYTLVGSKQIQENKSETMDSKEYLEYLKERVDNWLEEVKKIKVTTKKNRLINQMVEYSKDMIKQADEIKAEQKGLVYTNICKNCGKEIKVYRKNIRFCDEKCKKEYMKKKRHEYYENMSEEDKEKSKREATKRMKELRAKRKELKNGENI